MHTALPTYTIKAINEEKVELVRKIFARGPEVPRRTVRSVLSAR